MSNKLVKENTNQQPKAAPEMEKKEGLLKRIGNRWRKFKTDHSRLVKAGNVIWSITKVVAAGALLADVAMRWFGKTEYHDLPIDTDFKVLPDAEQHESLSVDEHEALVERVMEALPEMERVAEF